MSFRQLNELPDGIVKSSTPSSLSGRVLDINFGGETATGMGDPQNPTDGVNLQYADNNYVATQTSIAGQLVEFSDEFGQIKSTGRPSVSYNYSLSQLSTNKIITGFNNTRATKTADDTISANNQRIEEVLDPINLQDVVTVNYGTNNYVQRASSTVGHVPEYSTIDGQIVDSGLIKNEILFTSSSLVLNQPVIGNGARGTKTLNDDMLMAGFKITDVGNATNPTDVLNLQTADSRYTSQVATVINLSGSSLIPIVSDIGSGVGVNISLDQSTNQFVIDINNYTGTSTSMTLNVYRKTSIDFSGLSVTEANGITFVNNMDVNDPTLDGTRYFAEDPDAGGFSTPLSSSYRFMNSTSSAGNIWQLSVRIVGSDFDQIFNIEAIQLNVGNVPSISVKYAYLKVV